MLAPLVLLVGLTVPFDRLSGTRPETEASPPLPPGKAQPVKVPGSPITAEVKAVVVKSWFNGSASAWSELNVEWPNYGATSIFVDTSLGGAASFTYDDLVASEADVVILSDPAGGLNQFTDQEVAAIQRYSREGHNLIGTYLTFRWGSVDNTKLAPLFGFRGDLAFDQSASISNSFHVLEVDPLFNGFGPMSWQSFGYAETETYVDWENWSLPGLAGARLVAECDGYEAIVSTYATPSYVGIFFSNMPEYLGNPVDKQLLYNAIVYPKPKGARTR